MVITEMHKTAELEMSLTGYYCVSKVSPGLKIWPIPFLCLNMRTGQGVVAAETIYPQTPGAGLHLVPWKASLNCINQARGDCFSSTKDHEMSEMLKSV